MAHFSVDFFFACSEADGFRGTQSSAVNLLAQELYVTHLHRLNCRASIFTCASSTEHPDPQCAGLHQLSGLDQCSQMKSVVFKLRSCESIPAHRNYFYHHLISLIHHIHPWNPTPSQMAPPTEVVCRCERCSLSTFRLKNVDQPGRIWRPKSQAYINHRSALKNPPVLEHPTRADHNSTNSDLRDKSKLSYLNRDAILEADRIDWKF